MKITESVIMRYLIPVLVMLAVLALLLFLQTGLFDSSNAGIVTT